MIRRPKDKSRAAQSHLAIPAPAGLVYLPYQRAGVEYMGSRNRILLADEMGLGKTIQAIGLMNYRDFRRILVICPASVKINWEREIRKWTAFGLEPHYISGKKDSPRGQLLIINYELLSTYAPYIREHTWDLVVVDEAHYLKSGKADRTAQIFGRARAKGDKPAITPIPCANLLLMTGTPILNKPKELWPMLQVLDPEGLGADWFAFAKKYCDLFEIKLFDPAQGKLVHKGWKWDGATNLEELQKLMRERFMIRRLKKDVLKELPPKTRQIISLEAKKGLTKLLERDMLMFDAWVRAHGGEIVDPPAFSDQSKVRKEVAIAKTPYVIEYLREVLSEASKVVCFAHHHEVIDSIQAAFGDAAVRLDGRCDITARQEAVDLFQNDARTSLFIGGIQAAGVGISLTAASLAVFAECDWVPGNNSQAEDRLHRMGQKENVLIRYVVLNGSVEQRIIQANISKEDITEKTLN